MHRLLLHATLALALMAALGSQATAQHVEFLPRLAIGVGSGSAGTTGLTVAGGLRGLVVWERWASYLGAQIRSFTTECFEEECDSARWAEFSVGLARIDGDPATLHTYWAAGVGATRNLPHGSGAPRETKLFVEGEAGLRKPLGGPFGLTLGAHGSIDPGNRRDGSIPWAIEGVIGGWVSMPRF